MGLGRRLSSAAVAAVMPVAARLKDALETNPHARRLYYQAKNRFIFGDLWQHDKMLADTRRVETYHAAIARHVRPGQTVLDLGTGSGILSFFAARQGARVHALDHSPIIEVARRVARDNDIDTVVFHPVSSRLFTAPEPIDVLIHEQIGEYVFDENMVANILDLRQRVLRPGARILPAVIELYLEPMQLKASARVPFLWEQVIHDIRFGSLRDLGDTVPRSYLERGVGPGAWEQHLCAPAPLFRIDMETAPTAALPTVLTSTRPVVRAGRLDGLSLYFKAWFDDELCLDSSLGTPSWAAPFYRLPAREYRAGEALTVELTCADLANPATWQVRHR